MEILVILGTGTAVTIMLNKFTCALDKKDWELTIVDQVETRWCQPGFLLIVSPILLVFPQGCLTKSFSQQTHCTDCCMPFIKGIKVGQAIYVREQRGRCGTSGAASNASYEQ